jgi:hypothetical protein
MHYYCRNSFWKLLHNLNLCKIQNLHADIENKGVKNYFLKSTLTKYGKFNYYN